MKRLVHDVAFATAKSTIDRARVDPSDTKAIFALIYESVKAGLEAFVIQSEREAERLGKS
jgi:hypothetical protein